MIPPDDTMVTDLDPYTLEIGALRERERIVEWLKLVGTEGFSEEMTCSEAATFIRRGDHIK